MEICYNNDNYFFSILTPDLGLVGNQQKALKYISQNVINFSIDEEVGKITTGTLSLHDDDGLYSNIFRPGRKFNISWGYKKFNILNPLSMNGASRTGLQCFIQQPSGSGSGGDTTYNVKFYSTEFMNGRKFKTYSDGTRGTVVYNLLLDLGCTEILMNFNTMGNAILTGNQIIQDESSFNLLYKLAAKWNCIFHVGYSKLGIFGLFIDSTKLQGVEVQQFYQNTTGLTKPVKELYYNCGDKSNVSSFTWEQNIGENGTGDGVNLFYLPTGQIAFQHYVTSTQSFDTYVMNTTQMQKDINAQPDAASKINLNTQIQKINDFQTLINKRYFINLK